MQSIEWQNTLKKYAEKLSKHLTAEGNKRRNVRGLYKCKRQSADPRNERHCAKAGDIETYKDKLQEGSKARFDAGGNAQEGDDAPLDQPKHEWELRVCLGDGRQYLTAKNA